MVKLLTIVLVLILCQSLMAAEESPYIKTFIVGNIGSTDEFTRSTARWFANRYDFFLNVRHDISSQVGGWDTMMLVNPAAQGAIYTNLHMLGNRVNASPGSVGYDGGEYRAVMRFYDSADISAESAYVHFSNSIVYHRLTGETPARRINVDSLHGIGKDSATRVSLRYWHNTVDSGYYPAANDDWYCNITSPTYRHFRAAMEKFIFERQDSMYNWTNAPITWRYADNYPTNYYQLQPNYWATAADRRVDSFYEDGTWKKSVVTLDWDIKNNVFEGSNGETFQPYFTDYLRQLMEECEDSLHAGGGDGYIANMVAASKEALYTVVKNYGLSGVYFEDEGTGIVTASYTSGWKDRITDHDTVYAADSTCLQFWEYRFFPAIYDSTTALANEYFLAAVNSFLCFQTPSDYFKFGRREMDYYFSGHALPLGTAVDAHYDSLDYAGRWVFFRKYTNGYCFFRPIMGSGDAVTLYVNHDSLGLGDITLYQWGAHYGGAYVPTETITPGEYISIPAAPEGVWVLFGETPPNEPPEITNIGPLSGWRDSTDILTAFITDDNGISYVANWLRDPSNDSIYIKDSICVMPQISLTFEHEYTWLDSGNYQIYFKAVDEDNDTTIEYETITTGVEAVESRWTIYKNVSVKGTTLKEGP